MSDVYDAFIPPGLRLSVTVENPEELDGKVVEVTIRLCRYCRRPFVPNRNDHKFCSTKCRDDWKNNVKGERGSEG